MKLYKYNKTLYLEYNSPTYNKLVLSKVDDPHKITGLGLIVSELFNNQQDNTEQQEENQDPSVIMSTMIPMDGIVDMMLKSVFDSTAIANDTEIQKVIDNGENVDEVMKRNIISQLEFYTNVINTTMTNNYNGNFNIINDVLSIIKQIIVTYKNNTGDDKYDIFLMALDWHLQQTDSQAFTMFNLLVKMSQYPTFSMTNKINGAACGCGHNNGSMLNVGGGSLGVGSVCDITTMFATWMNNILYYYLISSDLWILIMKSSEDWTNIQELLKNLHLSDFVGCGCKDLTHNYSITSADILKWISLTGQLTDCPTNITFMWNILSNTIWSQLLNVNIFTKNFV